MKTKLSIFLISLSILMSACTLRVATPTYVSSDGTQQYSYVNYYLGGGVQPVITVINPYRQMSPR